MKKFDLFALDPAQCRKEVDELRKWLARHEELEERKHIQPFFRKRRHLAAFLGSYDPNLIRFDRLAFEYPLFGDFSCDVAVGDSVSKAYCFIEFEEARVDSVFVKQGKKATREWSSRFEHGFSQIVDWFCKLDDMRRSDDFAARFGARSISCSAMLVLGRDKHLLPGERERFEWRRRNVVVASQHVHCVTFDELLGQLLARLDGFRLSDKAGG